MAFTLPALPYASNGLEPHIDARTMEIHHDMHHNGYTNNLNNAIKGSAIENSSIEDILADISNQSGAVRNNGGGFYNHCMFWEVMSPNGGGTPTGQLATDIDAKFGSFDAFKTEFSAAAATRFGSGWAWLIVDAAGKLAVTSTPNQDNPMMDIAEVKGTPLLCVDVWEHAYYLKYQNRRPEYLTNFFNVVNWEEVSKRYESAK
ncbi:MAG: Fe-Mn family superoxide dismutase [Salibacteraceae bacterium]|jgi:Fe-Mn family superoxide dismutase